MAKTLKEARDKLQIDINCPCKENILLRLRPDIQKKKTKINTYTLGPSKIDATILRALKKGPNASTHQLAQMVHASQTTVYNHLTNNLGYKYTSLRCVPHLLGNDDKLKRVSDSRALLKVLQSNEKNKWKFLYTGDESWFLYDNQIKKIWLPHDSEPPTNVKQDIMTKKIMICIFWNPNGIIVIDGMERGMSMNSEAFIDKILIPITESHEFAVAKKQKKTITLHMDNSRVHRSTMVNNFMMDNKLKNAPHPPYSPDLAPSDFYLFGYLKHKMIGLEFSSVDELKQYIIHEFSLIPKEKLIEVFQEWERRLRSCISNHGDYIE